MTLFLCALAPPLWALYPEGLWLGLTAICAFLLGLILRRSGLLILAFFSLVGLGIYAAEAGHLAAALAAAILGLAAWDLGNLSIWSKARLPGPAAFATGLLSLSLSAVGALLALLSKDFSLRLSSPFLFLLAGLLWLALWAFRRTWE